MTGPTIQDDLFTIRDSGNTNSWLQRTSQRCTDKYSRLGQQTTKKYSGRTIRLNHYWHTNWTQWGTGPCLVSRTLYQLASDKEEAYNRAVATFKSEFYMEDLITGADTYEDALALRHELTQLANKGGFELCQWASNHPGLVDLCWYRMTTPQYLLSRPTKQKENSAYHGIATATVYVTTCGNFQISRE